MNKIDLLGLTIFWIDMGNGQLWFKKNFNGIHKHALWNDGNQTWDEFNPLNYIKNNCGDQTKSWAENLFDGTVDMWRTVWESGIGGDYVHSVNRKGITTVRGRGDNGERDRNSNNVYNSEENENRDNQKNDRKLQTVAEILISNTIQTAKAKGIELAMNIMQDKVGMKYVTTCKGLGNALNGAAIVVTIVQIRQGEYDNSPGEAVADLMMGAVAFAQGWGWVAAGAYFIILKPILKRED